MEACAIYGGASRGGQGRELRRRPEIVVATPGRLLDFLDTREIDLGKVVADHTFNTSMYCHVEWHLYGVELKVVTFISLL